MIKICVQAGHVNRTSGATGAPEEQANNKRITDRVCGMLRERGFEVYQTDAYGNNDSIVTKTDWNLFLSLHCDMDYPNDGGSCFADYCDPLVDGATQESQRICKIINEVYPREVGIKYVNHSNKNTRGYYMWNSLTAKTPCVLLEMGQSIDPHDRVLLGNTELIASAIVRALCRAFNVSYEIEKPIVSEPVIEKCDCEALKSEVEELKKTLETTKSENLVLLSDKDVECQNKIISYKENIINFINLL